MEGDSVEAVIIRFPSIPIWSFIYKPNRMSPIAFEKFLVLDVINGILIWIFVSSCRFGNPSIF